MPSTDRNTAKRRPSRRQLSYLRALALETGTTFVYPYTFGKAASEISRLIALKGELLAARDADEAAELDELLAAA